MQIHKNRGNWDHQVGDGFEMRALMISASFLPPECMSSIAFPMEYKDKTVTETVPQSFFFLFFFNSENTYKDIY